MATHSTKLQVFSFVHHPHAAAAELRSHPVVGHQFAFGRRELIAFPPFLRREFQGWFFKKIPVVGV